MNKFNFFNSLQGKLIVMFIVITILPALIIGFVANNKANSLLESSTKNNHLNVAINIADRTEQYLLDGQTAITILAKNPFVAELGSDNQTAVMKSFYEASGMFELIFCVDDKGIIKNVWPRTDFGGKKDFTDRQWYRDVTSAKKTIISDTYISAFTNMATAPIVAPIFDSTGNLIGYIGGNIKLGNITELTKKLNVGHTGRGIVLDKNKFYVTDSRDEQKAKKHALFENQTLLNVIKEGEHITLLTDFDKVESLVSYAPIGKTGWSVLNIQSKSEAYSNASDLRNLIITVILLSAISVAIIGYIFVRRITTPIKLAVDHLSVIAGGDFTQAVDDKFLRRTDEIGQLTRALDKLQRDLRPLIGGIRSDAKTLSTSSENLSAASQQVASSSTEVAKAIQEVATGASDQAASLQDIVDLIGDITSQLEKVYTELGRVENSGQETSAMAEKGKQELDLLTASIDSVRQTFQQVMEKLANLDKSVGQIGEIMGVITGIADQTNLLALNAAIEAARAGEAGRGFAVVAEEVRKLAEQSRASAEKIKALLNSIGTETGEVVENARVTQEQMTKQIENVKNTVRSFDDILASVAAIAPMVAAAYQEMDKTVKAKDAVLDRVQSVSAVAEETSAASEEIAASSEELTATTEEIAASIQQVLDVAKRLDEQVERFKV